MKKLLLISFLLSLLFVSCGDSDDKNDITLKVNEITLNYLDEYQIEATSDSKINYESENEFHATVSDFGVITGKKVGETNILLSNEDDTKKIKVTIAPKSKLYPEPIMEWGKLSRSDMKKRLGDPYSETETIIMYTNYSNNATIVMYSFDDNNKLNGASVMVKSSVSSELSKFLNERYLAYDSDNYSLFFLNGLTERTCNMAVGVNLYNISYWMVVYVPINMLKSKSSDSNDKYRLILDQYLQD